MSNYNKMYKTICRLCLTQKRGEVMVSLFDDRSDDGLSCFGQAIITVTNIHLHKDDKLPNVMCKKCAYLLKHAVYFKLQCEASNAKLIRFVEQSESVRSIKEKVCDYVIYSKYFPLETNSSPATSKQIEKNGLRNDDANLAPNQIEIEITEVYPNTSDEVFNFDGFLSNDDNDDANPEENSGEDNILDTIQEIINTDCSILNKTQKICRKNPPAPKTDQNLTCNICQKKLANPKTYAHHVERHSLCRYICDQCGKGFPVRAEMHMHQVARHGIGPGLKCDRCPYKAPRRIDLVEHIRLHTGERPFTCEKCGLTFRRKAIYKKHLIHHLDKTVSCPHCPMKFYERAHMLAHSNNVHERLYMFMCYVCNVTYADTKTVRRHMVAKHGIPREKQGKVIRINHKSSSSSTNKLN